MPRPRLTDAQKRLRGTFNKQYSGAARELKADMRASFTAAYLDGRRRRRKSPRQDNFPDLREDPWFYLDLDHGDDRLRRLLAREDAPG